MRDLLKVTRRRKTIEQSGMASILSQFKIRSRRGKSLEDGGEGKFVKQKGRGLNEKGFTSYAMEPGKN